MLEHIAATRSHDTHDTRPARGARHAHGTAHRPPDTDDTHTARMYRTYVRYVVPSDVRPRSRSALSSRSRNANVIMDRPAASVIYHDGDQTQKRRHRESTGVSIGSRSSTLPVRRNGKDDESRQVPLTMPLVCSSINVRSASCALSSPESAPRAYFSAGASTYSLHRPNHHLQGGDRRHHRR